MAEDTPAPTRPASLLVFALATFHVTLLTTTGLVVLHSSGSVGRLLAGLDTLTGFILFLALWAITWRTTRWVLARAPLDPENPDSRLRSALLWGYLGGSVTGMAFLPVAFFLVFLSTFGLEFFANLASFIVLVFGIPVAAIVGGFVGAAFGLIDMLTYRVASAFVP